MLVRLTSGIGAAGRDMYGAIICNPMQQVFLVEYFRYVREMVRERAVCSELCSELCGEL